MEQSQAVQKFFSMAELVAELISFLPPKSALHLAQSGVLKKGILQKSLGSDSWNKVIRQGENGELKKEDVKCLVKILKRVELDQAVDQPVFQPSNLILPLLDRICKLHSNSKIDDFWVQMKMSCPCNPEPHVISREAFLLLELVEGAFGTTLQSIQSLQQGQCTLEQPLLSAISSRMTRMDETVTSISAGDIIIDNNTATDFATLLQAQSLKAMILRVEPGTIGEEVWPALARALREKPGAVKLGRVRISRQGLAEARIEDIQDILDATDDGFWVSPVSGFKFLRVGKDKFDRESFGPGLNQIFAYTEEEFMAVVDAEWAVLEAEEESSYYSSTSGEDGDSESGEEEEEHDGGEDGSEDEDLGEEGGQGGD